jgi:hypothetical protein
VWMCRSGLVWTKRCVNATTVVCQVIHTTPVYNLLCIFSPLFTTVRPEDGQARPKHVVTFDNKIQNQDSCVFRQILPPSFDESFLIMNQNMWEADCAPLGVLPTNGVFR